MTMCSSAAAVHKAACPTCPKFYPVLEASVCSIFLPALFPEPMFCRQFKLILDTRFSLHKSTATLNACQSAPSNRMPLPGSRGKGQQHGWAE